MVQAHTTDPTSPNAIVTHVQGVPITRRSFHRLQPNVWLDDDVINAYSRLLLARERRLANMDPNANPTSHIFSTFFYQKLLDPHNRDASLANQYSYDAVRRWGRTSPSRDLFRLRLLLIPVNIGASYWICVEIDFPARNIHHARNHGL